MFKKKAVLLSVFIVFLSVFGLFWSLVPAFMPAPFLEWTMIDLTAKDGQGDAHFLSFPTGQRYLLDAGPEGRKDVLFFLQEKRVDSLDKVIISHPHKDHYAGLPFLLESGIRVKEVHMNIPRKDLCDYEMPWGCDYAHFMGFVEELKNRSIPIRPVSTGEFLFRDPKGAMVVLYAHDGFSAPVGRTDINDMSLILRLEYFQTRILFTGDLNKILGSYLTDHLDNLSADIVKVPHHGVESLAPDVFFDKVGALVAMVPASRDLWSGESAFRLRDYLKRKGTQTFVSGIHGDVTLFIHEKGYKIRT